MHLFAVTREPSESHIFKSLAVLPEERTKFMGHRPFYLLLRVITQCWTLIIIPDSVHPCYDFHDKVTLDGISPHTPRIRSCATCLEKHSSESRSNAGLSGRSRTAFGTSLADGQEPCKLPSQSVQSTGHQNNPPFPASNLTCCQLTPISKGCPERWGWIVYLPLHHLCREGTVRQSRRHF